MEHVSPNLEDSFSNLECRVPNLERHRANLERRIPGWENGRSGYAAVHEQDKAAVGNGGAREAGFFP